MLPHSPLLFIWSFVKKQKYKFVYLVFTSAMWAINDSFFPYFIKHIVNGVELYRGPANQIFSAVAWPLMALMALWLFTEITGRTQGFVGLYFFPKFRAQIRESILRYVKQHSHEYFANQFAGNIAKKLSDLPTSSQTIVENICYQFVPATTGVLMVLIMMWTTKPIFALVVLVWLTSHLSFTLIFMRRGNRLWEIQSEASSVLSGKIIDILTNMLNVRLFARNEYEMSYLRTYQDDEIQKSQQAQRTVEWLRVGLGLSGLFLIFSMMFLLIYGYAHQWVTLGDFTQVSMQSFWILGWIWFLSYQISLFAREMGTVKNALELIIQPHAIVDKTNAKALIVTQGKIIFDDICFSYQEGRPIFQNLNVEILPGKKIGLVGFSGSGKSTFVNLMLRFYEPNQGKILIDDQNIANVTQGSLREQIAMIPQEPALFHRSLMENIRYGRLDATDEEVINAAKLAGCHEFISVLDDGYHALVGERGVKLSGGQRQRVAIARALLKNAPILILDEATSALDSVTEKLIQKSLNRLMQGRTTIVIAHRLSTLASMDELLVFHEGKIIERGTQAELLAKEGHFAHLWKMQADGFLPENA